MTERTNEYVNECYNNLHATFRQCSISLSMVATRDLEMVVVGKSLHRAIVSRPLTIDQIHY